MSETEKYTRRADAAERRAVECLDKIGFNPQSRAAYEREHDWAIADMFLYDALARASVQNPGDILGEMQKFLKAIETEPVLSTAISKDRLLNRLKFLLDGYIANGE